MSNTRLITMLTYNDKTVNDAYEVFQECKDLPNELWGFKDVGISKSQLIKLSDAMRDTGKTRFLEVVTYSESECMNGAKLAVELGMDYLMGTIFYESVWKFLKDKKTKYLPFVGKVHSSPSILEGEFKDIVREAEILIERGVDGFDLLAFRHAQGTELLKFFVEHIRVPVVVAGSINSLERIDYVRGLGVWGFTIGSAFFDSLYTQGGFKSNLEFVLKQYENKGAVK